MAEAKQREQELSERLARVEATMAYENTVAVQDAERRVWQEVRSLAGSETRPAQETLRWACIYCCRDVLLVVMRGSLGILRTQLTCDW